MVQSNSRPRPATVDELYANEMASIDRTPRAVAQQLLDFCAAHDLEMTKSNMEAYFIRTPTAERPQSANDYKHEIFVHLKPFFRICRNTGLWLPGKVTLTGGGNEMIAYATCYTRASATDTQWVEVGAHARKYVYYRRESDGVSADLQWEVRGDIMLANVAQVLAAQKALGERIEDVRVDEVAENMVEDRNIIKLIEDRRKKAVG